MTEKSISIEYPIEEATYFSNMTTPSEAINSLTNRASSFVNTALLEAQEANNKYNDLLFENQGLSAGTRRKISEAVEEVKKTLTLPELTTTKSETLDRALSQSCSIRTSVSTSKSNGQL